MIIGTRGSRLALWQANHIKDQLAENGIEAELKIIKTQGDKIQHLGFDKLEGKGFFTKELEEALLTDQIDIAVHSLKDLPTEGVEGLSLAALSERADPADVLLIRQDAIDQDKPYRLKARAKVGTSSVRRQAQLLEFHPELEMVNIRGNVPTRVNKAKTGEVDAVALAAAGLDRLELDTSEFLRIRLSPREFIPAPAQGVMALQVKTDNMDLRRQLIALHHVAVGECTNVERKVLNLLEGGCQLPLGVYCDKDQLGHYHVSAALGMEHGVVRTRVSQSTRAGLAEEVLKRLGI
ncbi:MAG: hydroxymethylbilane synthase [Bacteroidota bacterium]